MFKILRMGYNTIHESDFSVNRPNGYAWYLLLLIKSPAIFYIEGQEILVPQNTLIVYDKNYPHKYKANNVPYINDWIHFELDSFFVTHHQIQLNTPLVLPSHSYLIGVIEKISGEYFSNNPYKDLTIEHLMNIFFIKAREYTKKELYHSNLHKDLIELRSAIYSNPQYDWTIPMMAQRLNVSSGYLQNIYKDTFNTTCMSEVIQSRIIHAKELLISTDYFISEISNLCGYKNEVHFMRQFKKITSLTPSEYRKKNQIWDCHKEVDYAPNKSSFTTTKNS